MGGHDSSDSDATVFGGDLSPAASPAPDPDRTVFADESAPPATPPAPSGLEPDSTVYDPGRLDGGPATPPRADSTPREDRSDPTFEGVDRTAHAMAAVELGTLFKHRFSLERFGISPRYRVDLRAPDGMSTAGGELARQSLVMFPDGRRYERVLVFGFVDGPRRQVELRSYASLGRIFEARFKRPIDLVESEYDKLADALRTFADTQGLFLRVRDEGPEAAGEAEPGTRAIGVRYALMAAATLLVAGVLIGYLLAT